MDRDTSSQKSNMRCRKCGDTVNNVSCISCKNCARWTHAKKACSGLSAAEAKRDVCVQNFICVDCEVPVVADPIPMDLGDDMSKDLKSAFGLILRELADCRKQMSKLHDDNVFLMRENADIKHGISKLQKQLSTVSASSSVPRSTPGRSHSRGRSQQRFPRSPSNSRNSNRLPDLTHRKKIELPLGSANPRNLRNNQNKNNLRTLTFDHPKTKTANRPRASNAHVVSESSYETVEAKNKLVNALPLTKVKYCTRNVFVTLYNSATSAENMLQHLNENNYDVNKVLRIKTRSRSENYRCFAIECSDLDYDDIRNNENLWHPGTLVGDMMQQPSDEKILETAVRKI